MGDVFRLVFRGEVLEGQHPAVVRKRLGEAADFDQVVLDKLFSGRTVVLKREADTATAARFQALFKRAGARLRVLPVQADGDLAQAPEPSAPAQGRGPSDPVPGSLEVLPTGADVLREDERTPWQPREVDTGDLTLEKVRFAAPEDATPVPAAPDVSHLVVAELGENLGPGRGPPDDPVQAPDFDVAEVGEDLGPCRPSEAPPIDLATLQFEVAPVGADLNQRKRPPAPAAPDTSHLKIARQD
jgi:hypothetical protein